MQALTQAQSASRMRRRSCRKRFSYCRLLVVESPDGLPPQPPLCVPPPPLMGRAAVIRPADEAPGPPPLLQLEPPDAAAAATASWLRLVCGLLRM
jgi:hypothetical protein